MLKKRLIAGIAVCLMAVSAFSASASANSALENMKATIYGGARFHLRLQRRPQLENSFLRRVQIQVMDGIHLVTNGFISEEEVLRIMRKQRNLSIEITMASKLEIIWGI